MVRKGIGMRPVDWSALPDSMEVFAPA